MSMDSEPTGPAPTREEMQAALFADLVARQSNMALMFMGQVPVPGAKERTVDLDAAQMFIDQLEMIEAKTRGNLTKDEEHFLKQNLMQLRLVFVKAAEQPASAPEAEPPKPSEQASTQANPPEGEAVTPDSEHKVKYSKRY
jgi:hypothetical protein